MNKQKIDKDYFYDFVFRIKLTPSEWYIVPGIYLPLIYGKKYEIEDDIILFRFEWLFFAAELQRWEKISFDGVLFTKEDEK